MDFSMEGRVGESGSYSPKIPICTASATSPFYKERPSLVRAPESQASLASATSRRVTFRFSKVASNAAIAAYQAANVRYTAHLGAAPIRRRTKGKKFHVVMC